MKRILSLILAFVMALVLINVPNLRVLADEATPDDASAADYYDSRDIKIKNNISIDGVDVFWPQLREAVEKINSVSDGYKSANVTLNSDLGNISTNLDNLGFFSDTDGAVKEAIACGNSGNILKRYKETKQVEAEGKDVSLVSSVNENKLSEIIEGELGSKIHVGNEYELSKAEDGTVSVKILGATQSVDVEATLAGINSHLSDNWHGDAFSSDIIINDGTGKKQQELDSIKDLLGEFSTNYSSASGRMKNVERATSFLNGKVLFPGQGLSVYDTISPITAANGYYDAPVFSGNTTKPGIGGGVCQVSTTLYNALLLAEVSITRRDNHGMTVHYVDLARDAAISGHVQNLEFVNNFDTPIYIEGFCYGGYVTFRIYGKETRPANRKIELVSKTIKVISPPDGEEITEDLGTSSGN